MTPPHDEAASHLHGARRALAIAAVLSALVLVVLDSAITNVALPTIARVLHASPASSVWIITGYQSAGEPR
jgi:MFS transporter, DHA2 family, multidrug resistance protein